MKNLFNRKSNGNISLTLVLVTTAILISAGTTLLLGSIDFASNSKSFNSSPVNSSRSRSCAEEAISRVKSNTSFTGTVSITFSDGSCSSTVTNDTSSGIKIITSTSNYGIYNFSEVKKLDTNQTPFVLSN